MDVVAPPCPINIEAVWKLCKETVGTEAICKGAAGKVSHLAAIQPRYLHCVI